MVRAVTRRLSALERSVARSAAPSAHGAGESTVGKLVCYGRSSTTAFKEQQMSGSGGGGDWRRPPATPTDDQKDSRDPGAPSDPCSITEMTALNSPAPKVLSTLRAGAVLDVDLEIGPPRRLLVRTRDGQIAGTITSPKSSLIIQCIEEWDREYQAVVQDVRGGLCTVEIQPV